MPMPMPIVIPPLIILFHMIAPHSRLAQIVAISDLSSLMLAARSNSEWRHARGSLITRATTAPDRNVSTAMTEIAQAKPNTSAMIPAESAPSA